MKGQTFVPLPPPFATSVVHGMAVQTPTLEDTPAKGRWSGWIARPSRLAFVLGVATCASHPDEPSSPSERVTVRQGTEPQIYGGVDDDDDRSASAVVALRVGPAGNYQLCSAVLVAPNVVLTARHCVANSITTSVSCDEHGRS